MFHSCQAAAFGNGFVERILRGIGGELFAVAGAASLLFLALKVSSQSSLPASQSYELIANFENIGSLKAHAPIKSAGVVVGRVTGLSLDTQRYVARVSRIGLDFGWATQVNLEEDTDEPDITRTDFIASYAYDFTASVTAEVGYNYQTRDEDPIDTDSHRVFLVLGKTFETGL